MEIENMRRMLYRVVKLWYTVVSLVGWKIFGIEYLVRRIYRAPKGANIQILKRSLARIGAGTEIETNLQLHNVDHRYTNLLIGNNSHIGKSCFFDLRDRVIIKDNVTISMQTTFLTHLDVGTSNLKDYYPPSSSTILIGNNCYIGAKATILMGVELGEGCFVGAGSLVKDSFPSRSFIVGVPAHFVKNV